MIAIAERCPDEDLFAAIENTRPRAEALRVDVADVVYLTGTESGVLDSDDYLDAEPDPPSTRPNACCTTSTPPTAPSSWQGRREADGRTCPGRLVVGTGPLRREGPERPRPPGLACRGRHRRNRASWNTRAGSLRSWQRPRGIQAGGIQAEIKFRSLSALSGCSRSRHRIQKAFALSESLAALGHFDLLAPHVSKLLAFNTASAIRVAAYSAYRTGDPARALGILDERADAFGDAAASRDAQASSRRASENGGRARSAPRGRCNSGLGLCVQDRLFRRKWLSRREMCEGCFLPSTRPSTREC